MEEIKGAGELLRAENITKYYGKKLVLDGVSLSVVRGETVAVTGRSGAGKSTLLSILGTLDTPTDGSVFFEGNRLTRRTCRKYRRDSVGFVFQDSCLIDEYTAYENILSSVRLSRSREDPMKYLSLVGLEDKKNSYPEKLSGGEARRVSLARALAKRPKLLLLDEPTEGLDAVTGGEIMDLILRLCEADGIAVVMVTHNEGHAARMSRIMRIGNGKLSAAGERTREGVT